METKNQQNDNNVVRCDCGTPLVKRLNSRKFEFMKWHNGRSAKFTAEHSGNKFGVHCEKCGRNITFTTSKIRLGLSYAIAPLKT